MTSKIRTLDFLPEIFRTNENRQFLSATLDQLVQPGNISTIEGYIGSKFGYGVKSTDNYVREIDKVRTNYQLEPAVVFLKKDSSTAKDLLTYPGFTDSLKTQGGIINNDSSLFENQFYSWDSFTCIDKIVNFNQYYWLPRGPEAVKVTSEVAFNDNVFTIKDVNTGYRIVGDITTFETQNPTLFLTRGNTYQFILNQNSPFWIQGKPGVTGYDPFLTNINTREIAGIINNGANYGTLTFTVPYRNDQDFYKVPGDIKVDLATDKKFNEINGKRISEINGIDTVLAVKGKTLIFYGTEAGETGYLADFYELGEYAETDPKYSLPASATVSETRVVLNPDGSTSYVVVCSSTVGFKVNNSVSFNGIPFGGLSIDKEFFIKEIIGPTEFVISEEPNGPQTILTNEINTYGVMTATINLGVFEDSKKVIINNYIFKVDLIGNPEDPVIILSLDQLMPTNQKITARYGSQWTNRNFIRLSTGEVILVPYLSAELDTLYYQDANNEDKFGKIRLVDNDIDTIIDVERDILGEKSYTSPNGVRFTNGLKVIFFGDVFDVKYRNKEFYIEGVGTGIRLVNAKTLEVIERFSQGIYSPFDTGSYDTANYELTADLPVTPDYITINRGSLDLNPWSRSNRWFHRDVLIDTAKYNNDPELLKIVNAGDQRAKRPIIEFNPDIKLYDSGVISKGFVDFIDFSITNAFDDNITVEGFEVVEGEPGIYFYTSDDPARTNANRQAAIPLFDGAKVIFAKESDSIRRKTIYVVNIEKVEGSATNSVITLSKADEIDIFAHDQVIVRNPNTPSITSQFGKSYYFDGSNWNVSQEKNTVNQPPLFDIFDKNGISFGDRNYYNSTTFSGNKLLSFDSGSGANDSVLGFPIKYTTATSLGDIQFKVDFNSESFEYLIGTTTQTLGINQGFVHRYAPDGTYKQELGWQPAAEESFQYQIFDRISDGSKVIYCDVMAKPFSETKWNPVQIYVNNQRISSEEFIFEVDATRKTTIITLNSSPNAGDPIQILIYSDQVSKEAYYEIPSNLKNNPFNEDISVISVGEIRGHMQTIFKNFPYINGSSIGANNFRDMGNLVPFGTRLIQHSSPLFLSAMFLRNTNHNIFSALTYNSNEYVKFKALLMDTVNRMEFTELFVPDQMLDSALEIIASAKDSDSAFFWSDMVPIGTAYAVNNYRINNFVDQSVFNLSKIYDFTKANYDSVLIYVTKIAGGVQYTTQLIKGVDYQINNLSPQVVITYDLQEGDIVTIKEYNKTYGSFVPSTPTKLGLYNAYKPEIVFDDTYVTPAYFIKGHDGSFTKLYGEYNDGLLKDFRDKVLFEFEKRIYNNLKVSDTPTLNIDEVIPGKFRNTGYSVDDFQRVYSAGFLNWVGQNRIDYRPHFYDQNNPFTWNYKNSTYRLDDEIVSQGNWRGVYRWVYDTDYPHQYPWEMLGYSIKPTWWDARYGEAPYTSDNTVLWGDLENGLDWNNGNPVIRKSKARPGLMSMLPVDSQGNLVSPFYSMIGSYSDLAFDNDWGIADVGPAENAYLKSSTWPFELMKLFVLTKPSQFFGLGINTDIYKFNENYNQYLVNERNHIRPSDIEVYGNGNAVHSYINWIVDYEKQFGIDSVQTISDLRDNLDVRLSYRVAGFTDKDILKFYIEKSTPNSSNTSLLIPDNSYSVLLYDNQPFESIEYSAIIIQKTRNGYRVWGNAQNKAYFTVAVPKENGIFQNITFGNKSVKINKDFLNTTSIISYGTEFGTVQNVADFINAYGKRMSDLGMIVDQIDSGNPINWSQMIVEFLYWSQSGWEEGSIININPCAKQIKISKENCIIQPLTMRDSLVMNQNLLPIPLKNLSVYRDGTELTINALNEGDSLSYFRAYMFNMEHVVVFDNSTIFGDKIYNLVTGLRQQRLLVKGKKTAEWDGSVNASGFILNQDNVEDWKPNISYTKGTIVKYKSNYWIAKKIIQPSATFSENDWTKTDYAFVQKGLLPNPSLAAYESTMFYNSNDVNLENDASLLSFSLIGFRPRDYLVQANLTDTAQVNLYKSMIANKGTFVAANNLDGVDLLQGTIAYDVYENWAIKTSEYGGVLNNNFIDVSLEKDKLTGNPSILGITFNNKHDDVHQSVPLYDLYNFGRQFPNGKVLPLNSDTDPKLPYAGYANFDDMKVSAFDYAAIPESTIRTLYNGEYLWLAKHKASWNVFSPVSLGAYDGTSCNNGIIVTECINNLNNTATIVFNVPHGLKASDTLGIVNFDTRVDGYYKISQVPTLTTAIIDLALSSQTLNVKGNGLVFQLQSHRVAKGSEVSNLLLTNTAFRTTHVWVDEDISGSWAVYKKSLNYIEEAEIVKNSTTTFGDSVAYIKGSGYILGDATAGKVYFYSEDLSITPSEIVGDMSFGTAIAHANDVLVISQPTDATNKLIKIYKTTYPIGLKEIVPQGTITAPVGVTNWGTSLAISKDSNWLFVSAHEQNEVYAYHRDSDYNKTSSGLTLSSAIITGSNYIQVTGDQTLAELTGTLISFSNEVDAKTYTITGVIHQSGVSKLFLDRRVDSGYAISTTIYFNTINYLLSKTLTVSGLGANDKFGLSMSTNENGSKLFVGAPEADESAFVTRTGKVYAFDRIVQNIEIQREPVTSIDLGWEVDEITAVYKNFQMVSSLDFSYAAPVANTILTFNAAPGDIVTVDTNTFVLSQVLESVDINDGRPNIMFGKGLDCSYHGDELLVGSPFRITSDNKEGVVYRYTNEGKKYGVIQATEDYAPLISESLVFINGFVVRLPVGTLEQVVNTINGANINNITSYSVGNKLVISLINDSLSLVKNKLTISAFGANVLDSLGIQEYTKTQEITSPFKLGSSYFGYSIKFDEHGSFIVGAPADTRYNATTFEFTDDDSFTNDTIFDNNFTMFVDTEKNAGSVYMYDYFGNYGENINNAGSFVYAQSIVDYRDNIGNQPNFGKALDFNNFKVVIGVPDLLNQDTNGKVFIFNNSKLKQNWSVHRSPCDYVDVDRIKDVQIYSSVSKETYSYIDYIDPLSGKLLGAVQQNIDIISPVDPAGYNLDLNASNMNVWGKDQVGKIWFDTSNVRFVDYHQDDIVYNSKYWGTVFPQSRVDVYTWVESVVKPSNYVGPGTPRDLLNYSTKFDVSSTNVLVPKYYFWVKNTGLVYSLKGKTLSDTTITSYIENPQTSGIGYLVGYTQDKFGLYNCAEFIKNDSVLHIGVSTGLSEDTSYNKFTLIRDGNPDDFLPSIPRRLIDNPTSLYDKLIDSLSGVDEYGQVVPDERLPESLRYGISVRPRQTMFVNRYEALKNLLGYANSVLIDYPVTEIRKPQLIFKTGEFFDTSKYWQYVNWWGNGYNDTVKPVTEVEKYNDLPLVDASEGMIVAVKKNGDGLRETYIYTNNSWVRIGLENGTIQFSDKLWDYPKYDVGFGDTFFGSDTFNEYPSTETRNVIRSLIEEIFIDDLLVHRNKVLILTFQYIQSENNIVNTYTNWLTKTSLADVTQVIGELTASPNYQLLDQTVLEGYINEVKPYHVVIKDFRVRYNKQDTYESDVTDFDIPAFFNEGTGKFISPMLTLGGSTGNQFSLDEEIWTSGYYKSWFDNFGLSLTGLNNAVISKVTSYVSVTDNIIFVDNGYSFPESGIIKINDELISYTRVNRSAGKLEGLSRGLRNTLIDTHLPNALIYMDLGGAIVMNSGRLYAEDPQIIVRNNPNYPAPRREAKLTPEMSGSRLIGVSVVDPGEGYFIEPEIFVMPAYEIDFSGTNNISNTISLTSSVLQTGDLVYYTTDSPIIGSEIVDQTYYYVGVINNNIIALYENQIDAENDTHRQKFLGTESGTLSLTARVVAIISSDPVRQNKTVVKLDRTSYSSDISDWSVGNYYAGPVNTFDKLSSSNVKLANAQEFSDIPSLGLKSDSLVITKTNDLSNNSITSTTSISGLEINMPIVFDDNFGNLVKSKIYYVESLDLFNGTFKVSETIGGLPVLLSTATGSINAIPNPAILKFSISKVQKYSGNGLGFGKIKFNRSSNVVLGSNNKTMFLEQLEPGLAIYKAKDATSPEIFVGVISSIISNTELELENVVDPLFTPLYPDYTFTFRPQGEITTSTSSTTVTGSGTNFSQQLKPGMKLYVNSGVLVGTISGIVSDTSLELTENSKVDMSGTYTYIRGVYGVSVTNPGANYSIDQQFTVGGSLLGGVDGVNDATVTVKKLTIDPYGIMGTLITGNPNLENVSILTSSEKEYVFNISGVDTSTTPISLSLDYSNSDASPGQIQGAKVYSYATPVKYSITPVKPNSVGTISTTAGSKIVNGIGTKFKQDFIIGMELFKVDGTLIGKINSIDNVLEKITLLKPATETLTNVNYQRSGFGLEVDVVYPYFSYGKVYNNYGLIIKNPGGGYYVGDKLTILGSQLGGTDGINDAVITVNTVALNAEPNSPLGRVLKTTITGLPVDPILNTYYIRIRNNYVGDWNSSTIYELGQVVSYNGIKYTPKHLGDWKTDVVYYLGDVVRFDGKYYTPNYGLLSYSAGIPCSNTSYWRLADNEVPVGVLPTNTDYWKVDEGENDNQVLLYSNPAATKPITEFPFSSNDSFLFIEEPFSLNVSRVVYEGIPYRCLQSNNDIVFDYDKWERISSDDESLNALDRVAAFYKPTSNMPGRSIIEREIGSTYPNNIFYGNPFDETEQYPLDMIIQSEKFFSTDFQIADIIWDGNSFVGIANTEKGATTFISQNGENWDVNNISEQNFLVNSIYYGGSSKVLTIPVTSSNDKNQLICATTLFMEENKPIVFLGAIGADFGGIILGQTYYVKNILDSNKFTISNILVDGVAGSEKSLTEGSGYMTFELTGQQDRLYLVAVNNNSTPLLASYDAQTWISRGPSNTYDKADFDDLGFDSSAVAVATDLLNSVENNGELFVAVGTKIFNSPNGVDWELIYTPSTDEIFKQVKYFTTPFYNGFVVVGSTILNSGNGRDWITASFTTDNVLNAATTNQTMLVAVGDDLTISISINGTNWNIIPTSQITGVVGTPNLLDVTYNGSKFIAVGEQGTVISSTDGENWQAVSIATNSKLTCVTWNGSQFIVGNDKGEVFLSQNGISWSKFNVLSSIVNPEYTISGDTFMAGYGPEELMSGVISDNINMYVRTIPTAGWDISKYPYYGFNLTSFSTKDTTVSFKDVTLTPTLLNVFLLEDSDNLGRRLYEGTDYTINWVTKTIEVASSVSPTQHLFVEIYELGNGEQLIRSNTDLVPLMTNNSVSEIYLDQYLTDVTKEQTIVYLNGSLMDSSKYNILPVNTSYAKIVFDTLYDTENDFISFVVYKKPRVGFFVYTAPNNVFNLGLYNFFTPTTDTFVVKIVRPNNVVFVLDETEYTIDEGNKLLTVNPTQTTLQNNDLITIYREMSYSIPETELFIYSGSRTFTMSNVVYEGSSDSIIVEVNGIKLVNDVSQYTINETTKELQIDSGVTLVNDDIIAVTSFNDITRQSLTLDSFTGKTVSTITNIGMSGTGITDTIRLVTDSNHNLSNGDLIYVKDITDLDDSILYYVRVVDPITIDIYYDWTSASENSPVVQVNQATGGYLWSPDNSGFLLTNNMVDQLDDAKRLWTTINGNRLSPDSMFFYTYSGQNYLGIAQEIEPTDSVEVLSMSPYAVPNQSEYRLHVDKKSQLTAYNVDGTNKTWLTEPINKIDNEISLYDVTKVISISEQMVRVLTDGETIGTFEVNLNVEKTKIISIAVYNETTGQPLSSSSYFWVLESTAPKLHLLDEVSYNDLLTISITYGNSVIVNGEEIRFTGVDLIENKLTGLIRGVNGTAIQSYLPEFTTVYSSLESDKIVDLSLLTKYPT